MVVLHLGAISKMLLHLFGLSPIFWPFTLYLPLARHLPGACTAFSSFATTLTFRLRRIMLDRPVAAGDGGRSRSGTRRWERAIRLLLQELRLAPSSSTGRIPPPDFFHVLSTITL